MYLQIVWIEIHRRCGLLSTPLRSTTHVHFLSPPVSTSTTHHQAQLACPQPPLIFQQIIINTMYTSYTSAVDKFFSLHKEAETWKSGAIHVTVAHSLTNDNPTIINLSTTIGYNKRVPKIHQRSNLNCFWLPQSFNENTEQFRQKEIHPMFVRACHAAGFIVHGEYEKSVLNVFNLNA